MAACRRRPRGRGAADEVPEKRRAKERRRDAGDGRPFALRRFSTRRGSLRLRQPSTRRRSLALRRPLGLRRSRVHRGALPRDPPAAGGGEGRLARAAAAHADRAHDVAPPPVRRGARSARRRRCASRRCAARRPGALSPRARADAELCGTGERRAAALPRRVRDRTHVRRGRLRGGRCTHGRDRGDRRRVRPLERDGARARANVEGTARATVARVVAEQPRVDAPRPRRARARARAVRGSARSASGGQEARGDRRGALVRREIAALARSSGRSAGGAAPSSERHGRGGAPAGRLRLRGDRRVPAGARARRRGAPVVREGVGRPLEAGVARRERARAAGASPSPRRGTEGGPCASGRAGAEEIPGGAG